MVLLLFGPPGCGKGTQSRLITNWLGIPAISTGEMLRAEYEAGTGLGIAAHSIMSNGGLVGDDVVSQMLVRRLALSDCRHGFLLDGYPRTVPQAKFVDNLLIEKGAPPVQVLHLDVNPSVLVKRMSSRRQCPVCGQIYNLVNQRPKREGLCDDDGTVLIRRKDDHESIIRERLKGYDQVTGPVLAHYASANYRRIHGDRPPAELFDEIAAILEPCFVKVRQSRGRH